jgi:hypothetical protein
MGSETRGMWLFVCMFASTVCSKQHNVLLKHAVKVHCELCLLRHRMLVGC